MITQSLFNKTVMKNNFKYLLLALLSITLISCDPDDDGNGSPDPDPTPQANEFKIGTSSYAMTSGFRSSSAVAIPNLFATNLVLVSDGLVLDTNSNELVGNGDIVVFEFYTAAGGGLQAGVYNLDNVNDQAQTVYVYTGIGYDSQTGDAASPDDIFQGTITVEELTNGDFKITGQGTADNANATFTVNYSGELLLVN